MAFQPTIEPSVLDYAILHTVIYADVFDYPLQAREIQRYLTGVSASPAVVAARLQFLVPGKLQQSGDFYTLPGRAEIVARREHREKIALKLWPQAVRYGRMIARLPFVRMLAITGSLAVNNVEVGADLDYLVVTSAGRLWVCRALVLAIGRLAGLRGVRVCPNYLISEAALEFPEQTLYAAHELAQMIPLTGQAVYDRIRTMNPWVGRFLPNAEGAPLKSLVREQTGLFLKVRAGFETVLRTRAGNWIENWEMERKISKLRVANRDNPEASFSADICKGHFNRHGLHTESSLRERLERFSLESVG